MRKVVLNMMESKKYKIIKQLVDSKNITANSKKRASVLINCSLRTIDRLINIYKISGKNGFCHGNKGRSPSVKYDEKLKRKIIDYYLNEYLDANITHFSEIVLQDFNVFINPETIRLWLLNENIVSPKTHRITKKRIKKKIKEDLKKAKSIKESNELKLKAEELDRKDAHPRRERCKYFGEMIQMDASELEWIKGQTWQLHLAIDDSTGTVVGAYFDYEETLNGYYNVLNQVLINYGIPAMFYTDRRTVFDYKRKNRILDDEDTFTQFSYCCHKLGIEIKTTSVAEAKGRVERLNGTFQSRLPIELRRANATSIEEANTFLISYLQKYNEQFALQPNTSKSVFSKQIDKTKINQYLAVLSVRTIDAGHSIKFKNKHYIAANMHGEDVYLQEGLKVVIVETFDGKLYINAFDQIYVAKEIKLHRDTSKEFDKNVSKTNTNWKVPRKHPWKSYDYFAFLAKQKHRPEYNQNLC